MKFAYKFSNLLGTVYKKGNILFSPSGDTVVALVGNRITFYDLKNNKSETLPIESRFNFDCIAISPNGYIFIAVNEVGEALLCSLVSRTVIHHHYFRGQIHDIKFSPNGRRFAVTKDNQVFVYKTPSVYNKQYNPFVLERIFQGAFDETVCLDWSSDSRVLAVGSKDMSTKVYAVDRLLNMRVCSLGSHSDCIVGCYFETDSLDMLTVGRNSQLCVWESNMDLAEVEAWIPRQEMDMEVDDSADAKASFEEKTILKADRYEELQKKKQSSDTTYVFYKRRDRFYLRDALKCNGQVSCTSASYHKQTKILVTGYSTGAFLLHEMPDCNLIHSLSLSEHAISAISMNGSGDWIALASAELGQLVVWEWQSETYVMKQQGHFNNMVSLAYSPDGQYVVTGGDDGKVKLWNTNSGFCFVTFNEHKSGVTGACFSHNGKVVLSASLDGTVRAYDMARYRNFRTFTSPRPAQFSCLTIDPSDDIVCAASQDTFEVFVWSMKNGRLLEVLSGHESPVSSISFSPSQAILLSSSWDKTVRIWDVFESKGNRETVSTISDALAVVFRPDGVEFAVATLNGQITFFNTITTSQMGSIDGRKDLGLSAKDTDLVTARKLQFGKAFNTLCYTADGECILAAGRSRFVCIYNVTHAVLLKKFEITCNLSLDGTTELINRRRMTEFGNVALVEQREDLESIAISLPGVRKGDMASRAFKPEIKVSTIQFSPTGRAWAAATTEGLLVYSLDNNLIFDPFELEQDITVSRVRKELSAMNYVTALMMALRLNEQDIIMEVLENIPINQAEFICQTLSMKYVEKLLSFLGQSLESSAHLEFYLTWIQHLLHLHGQKLKVKSLDVMSTLRLLQKNISLKLNDLGQICDHNTYLMQYTIALAGAKKKRKAEELEESDEDDDVPMNFDNNADDSG